MSANVSRRKFLYVNAAASPAEAIETIKEATLDDYIGFDDDGEKDAYVAWMRKARLGDCLSTSDGMIVCYATVAKVARIESKTSYRLVADKLKAARP